MLQDSIIFCYCWVVLFVHSPVCRPMPCITNKLPWTFMCQSVGEHMPSFLLYRTRRAESYNQFTFLFKKWWGMLLVQWYRWSLGWLSSTSESAVVQVPAPLQLPASCSCLPWEAADSSWSSLIPLTHRSPTEFWLLALTWANTSCFGHLVWKLVNGSSLSPFGSQINNFFFEKMESLNCFS